MALPRFDDPSRTADYGYFPWERNYAESITESDVMDFLECGTKIEGKSTSEVLEHLTTDLFTDLTHSEMRKLLLLMSGHPEFSELIDDRIRDFVIEFNDAQCQF